MLASATKLHHIYNTASESYILCESHGVCRSPLSWLQRCDITSVLWLPVTMVIALSRKIWCAHAWQIVMSQPNLHALTFDMIAGLHIYGKNYLNGSPY
jgi:hypothetical protein